MKNVNPIVVPDERSWDKSQYMSVQNFMTILKKSVDILVWLKVVEGLALASLESHCLHV